MGGSKSSDVKTTNITTTTETTMRDVGLTGQSAVDMAAIMVIRIAESIMAILTESFRIFSFYKRIAKF